MVLISREYSTQTLIFLRRTCVGIKETEKIKDHDSFKADES
ncbi:hypothetical protein LEP1GSC120_1321 [Leptospira santarosai str. 200702252]|nr:hypothetical protein LEP1GSC130_0399 [Leptospira santarosai str. 200403458]EMP00234.1 hypothetical protein LEP1GSC120_1321 [Leptospira santarosai str. 200702252]